MAIQHGGAINVWKSQFLLQGCSSWTVHSDFSGLQIRWTRSNIYDQSIYILVSASHPEVPASDRSYILEKKKKKQKNWTVFIIGLSIYTPN